jgi:hypothetical protein
MKIVVWYFALELCVKCGLTFCASTPIRKGIGSRKGGRRQWFSLFEHILTRPNSLPSPPSSLPSPSFTVSLNLFHPPREIQPQHQIRKTQCKIGRMEVIRDWTEIRLKVKKIEEGRVEEEGEGRRKFYYASQQQPISQLHYFKEDTKGVKGCKRQSNS